VRNHKKLDPAYANLGPHEILAALNTLDFTDNGQILALNSYENRVYRVGLESGLNIVLKFYRPNRWSDLSINEEHEFTKELVDLGIPVIAPMIINKKTLHRYKSYRFSIWECFGGRSPNLDDKGTLRQIGRLVARIHLHGELKEFDFRPDLNIKTYGFESKKYLIENMFIPQELENTYISIIDNLLDNIRTCFEHAGNYQKIRLHADLHPSNILTQGEKIKIVDLDDARNGPAIQDLWMFISGEKSEQQLQFTTLLEGYEEFRSLNLKELHLIEALRTLRIMHYTAWIAKRWDDPAFKKAFPWFDTSRFWDDHILSLREQTWLMQEAPLDLSL
jgi:Ser/Thr protein kinase RdoA (MazF antagonist)|tara:strand:- start:377 stop:1375 length:999 start_codon:yes stop_codon:yes gene_type:complete